MEVDLYRDAGGHRLSIQHRGTETPAADGFNRFLIESHAQTLPHADVVRSSIFPYHNHQQHNSLRLRLPSLIGETRLRAVDRLREADAASASGMNS